MTHQQIIKLAAQAESEGNYRFADFLDRELVRVSFNPLSFFGKGVGTAGEKALIRGIEQEIARGAKPGLLSTVGTKTKGVLDSVGQGFNTGYISRAFGEGTEAGTGAVLRSMETVAPKSGNIFQEAGGMLFGKGNKVITRTIEELIQAETKINQIITRIAQIGSKNIDPVLKAEYDELLKIPAGFRGKQQEQRLFNLHSKMQQEAGTPASHAAQKHMAGQKLSQAEMEVLYKEILKTDPTAFAGKSKMRPSDAFDMLVNRKITNAEMNKILSPAAKLINPNFKGSKWGTGLMAAGMGYAALNYGLPLLGAGVAGASAAGKAALNNMQGGNAGTAGQGGNVEGGSTTYGMGRDNASVGNSQYFANRAPSATVANKKTKWIKTSEL